MIRFKVPVLNNNNKKITRHSRTRNIWLIEKEKKKTTETVPKNDQMADMLNKDFKTKDRDAQRTKGTHGENKENDV